MLPWNAIRLTIEDEREVVSRVMLEGQRTFQAVRLAADNYKGSQEAIDFELVGKLLGVPDFAMLGFQNFSATGLGVDFDQHGSAYGFSWVGHGFSPGIRSELTHSNRGRWLPCLRKKSEPQRVWHAVRRQCPHNLLWWR